MPTGSLEWRPVYAKVLASDEDGDEEPVVADAMEVRVSGVPSCGGLIIIPLERASDPSSEGAVNGSMRKERDFGV